MGGEGSCQAQDRGEKDVFVYAKDNRIADFIKCLILNEYLQEADEVHKAIEIVTRRPSVPTRIWAETLLATYGHSHDNIGGVVVFGYCGYLLSNNRNRSLTS